MSIYVDTSKKQTEEIDTHLFKSVDGDVDGDVDIDICIGVKIDIDMNMNRYNILDDIEKRLDKDDDKKVKVKVKINRKRISSGERLCGRLLLELGIDYLDEYIFKGLLKRRYDFKFDYNNLKCIIEIDGPQHFNLKELNQKIKHRDYYKYMTKYEKYQESDIIKMKYCIENNISCLRIDYSIRTISKMKAVIQYYLDKLSISNKQAIYILSNIKCYDYLLCDEIMKSKFQIAPASIFI